MKSRAADRRRLQRHPWLRALLPLLTLDIPVNLRLLVQASLQSRGRPTIDAALRIMRDDFRFRLQAAPVPLSVESFAAAVVDAATDQFLRELGIPAPAR